MEWSVTTRRLQAVVCALVAGAALAACSGGGTTTGLPGGSSSGNGNGSGPGGGSGNPTSNPTSGASSSPTGSATSTPGASATATPAGGGSTSTPAPGGSATPTSTPGSITSSLSTLTIGPTSIVGNLGQSAQVGILDPNYSGPIALSVTGDTLLGDVLTAVTTLQTGVLEGEPGTSDVLDINLADIAAIGALGAAGAVVNICETAKTPPTCLPVNLTSNATANQISTNISDAVIVPGTFQLLQVAAAAGITNFSDFTVTSSNNEVTVQNLGNGQFDLGAAANANPPASAVITVNDGMGHTITIPVMLL